MSTPQGGLLPANYSRIWVRGQFIDLAGNSMRGTVSFTATPAVLLDRGTKHIISNKRFDSVLLDNTGKFAIELPATNDPDIIPTGWTYIVKEPTGRSYHMVVPWDTPRLDAPGDALDGERVIELIDIVPSPSASGGTVQLMKGRGIESVEVDGTGSLVLHYDDLTNSPQLPVGSGPDTLKDWTKLPSGTAPSYDLTDDFGNPMFYQNTGGSISAQVSANRLALASGSGPAQTVRFNKQLNSEVGKVGMSWAYSGVTTGGSLVLAIYDQYEMNAPGSLNARCYLRITPTGWAYDVIQNGVTAAVSSGSHTGTLASGRKLYTEVTFIGDTAELTLPDGQKKRITDTRIGNVTGTVAGWAFVKDSASDVYSAYIYAQYAWRAKPWPLA